MSGLAPRARPLIAHQALLAGAGYALASYQPGCCAICSLDLARLTTEKPLVRTRAWRSASVSLPFTILRNWSIVVARRTVSRGRVNFAAAWVVRALSTE